MLARIILPLVAAAVLVFACGPRARSAGVPLRAAGAEASEGGLVTDVRVEATRDVNAVRFALQLVNASEHQLELTFPSGQTHDFLVLDVSGREVWRWSGTRMFTQGMQSRLLDVADTARYVERWPDAPGAGRYTLVASQHSDSHPIARRVEFTLP